MSIPPIEFLKDRIYLAAYDTPPNDTASMVYFSIDDDLLYHAFYHDFGPLHIGHLYRFAVILHDVLGSEANAGKAVCLYSRANPRDRANAACALCCYMVLLQAWPPHLAVAPIAQADPPMMPFRDAGYASADFVLTIQDVVYAVWKAKECRLIDLHTFNLGEYERYERVDQGDFNEIPPHFIAFASPSQTPAEQRAGIINYPCQQVLDYFVAHQVQLVVRLNSFLYDRAIFEDRGIKHIDLVFDDGTCPTMDFVKAFIGAVEGVIQTPGAKVAVHCKAGLGRTGCLIGAHLIYTYGFTAQEAIAYMRFMRPGMVVGPQQHWLYLHQNDFRDWRRTMTVSSSASEKLAGYCPLVPKSSLRNRSRISSGVYSPGGSSPKTPERSILQEVAHNSALPVPTPGQPRKGSPMGKAGAVTLARRPISRTQRHSTQFPEHEQQDDEDEDRRESVYHDAASHLSDSVNNAEEEEEEEEDSYEIGNDTVVDGNSSLLDARSGIHRSRISNVSTETITVAKRTMSSNASAANIRSSSKTLNNSMNSPQKSYPSGRALPRANGSRTSISGSPEYTKTHGRYEKNKPREKHYNMDTRYNVDNERYQYNDDEYQVYNDEYNVYQDDDDDEHIRNNQNIRVVGFTGHGTNSDEEEDIDDEYNIEGVNYGSPPAASLVGRTTGRTNSDEEDQGQDGDEENDIFDDPDLENRYYDEVTTKVSTKTVSRRSSSPTRRSISANSPPSRRSSSQFSSSSPTRRPSSQYAVSVLPGKRNSGINSGVGNDGSPTSSASPSASQLVPGRTSSSRQQIIRVKKLRSSSGPIPVAGGVQVTTTTMTETTEFVPSPHSDPSMRHISRTASGVRKTSGSGRPKR